MISPAVKGTGEPCSEVKYVIPTKMNCTRTAEDIIAKITQLEYDITKMVEQNGPHAADYGCVKGAKSAIQDYKETLLKEFGIEY